MSCDVSSPFAFLMKAHMQVGMVWMPHRKAHVLGLGALVGIGITCGSLITAGGLTATARAATVAVPRSQRCMARPGRELHVLQPSGGDLAGADLAGRTCRREPG